MKIGRTVDEQDLDPKASIGALTRPVKPAKHEFDPERVEGLEARIQ